MSKHRLIIKIFIGIGNIVYKREIIMRRVILTIGLESRKSGCMELITSLENDIGQLKWDTWSGEY